MIDLCLLDSQERNHQILSNRLIHDAGAFESAQSASHCGFVQKNAPNPLVIHHIHYSFLINGHNVGGQSMSIYHFQIYPYQALT